jgi:GNAT superfamily N-acetyltransferase
MDVFVRPATAADIDAIVALVQAVRTELAPERGGQAWLVTEARPDPIRESLTTDVAGADVGVRVTVAGIDQVVLGVAVTREHVRHDGSRAANVEELVVDPDARGVGLGAALLDDAIAGATEAGADVIESTALPGQRATKNFFEAAGMKARLLVVSRSLRPDAAADPVDDEPPGE